MHTSLYEEMKEYNAYQYPYHNWNSQHFLNMGDW